MSLRLLVLASAAMTVLGAGSAATAADDPSSREVVVNATPAPGVQVRSQRVSYADLNLGSGAGAKALLARIHSAAQNVCGPAPATLEPGTGYAACVKSAESSAVGQVGNPLLTAAFQRQG